jgi:hypothetical protein
LVSRRLIVELNSISEIESFENDAKKTANKRAFNSMLGTAAGMFLTILGMVFAGLWFSIESEDFKVSQFSCTIHISKYT